MTDETDGFMTKQQSAVSKYATDYIPSQTAVGLALIVLFTVSYHLIGFELTVIVILASILEEVSLS